MQISGKENADLQNPDKNTDAKNAINGQPTKDSKRIGIAKWKFIVPNNFDAGDDEIAALLIDGDL